jgi:hypothetical protein
MTTPAPDSVSFSGMRTHLKGRVENVKLNPRRDVLQPIFEAVSNSLQSIAASGRHDGLVRIELFRNPAQGQFFLSEADRDNPDRTLPEISSVKITDNGQGFSQENYDSFLTLDSRAKTDLGGKGVGRLVWLKMFESVEIDSTFLENSQSSRRHFLFSLQHPTGISPLEAAPQRKNETLIILSGLRPEYRKHLRHRASTIKGELVKHFLSIFLAGKFPRIEVIDGEDVHTISPDDLPPRSSTSFELAGTRFDILHLKIKSPQERQHAVYYCAHHRVVRSERIKGLPASRFEDSEGAFFYQAYVTSQLLDDSVNQERTGFSIEDDVEGNDLLGEVTFAQLRDLILKGAQIFLAEPLARLEADKQQRISTILDDEFPEYGYLRSFNAGELERIPVDATLTDIEDEVAQIHFRNQKTGRQLLGETLRDMEKHATFDSETFTKEFGERFESATTINQASLFSYLLFRQSILDLYDQILRKSGDQFQKESAIHNLIFPMGKEHTSTQAFLKHNLWLIDERLTYANYIASDKQIRTHKPLFGVASAGEPDIALYYNLGFSSDSIDDVLHNVVIVEFKRPGPLAHRVENPYQQIVRYIRDIREGFYRFEDGKKIKVADTTRFYCYIVCDLDNETIRQMVEENQFRPLFGGQEGYSLYNDAMRAYIELVPFERILRDAKRNHRAFFDSAGLLPRNNGRS